MHSRTIAQYPLAVVYVLVKKADSPVDVLGVDNDATADEIRNAYHALALRVHPDKAPDDGLHDLHTALFQKVQTAYNTLLARGGRSGDAGVVNPKRLPESFESLHARNCAFKEALRAAREKALKVKMGVDEKQAKIKAKNEMLAEKRMARERSREPMQERQWEKRQKKLEKEQRNKLKGKGQGQAPQPVPVVNKDKFKMVKREKKQDKIVNAIWDNELDERLVSDADIAERWTKNLLSGGRAGFVSLGMKKQKDNNAAARSQKVALRLTEEAGDILRPALTGKTKTFSFASYDELMEAASIGVEGRAEARTDRILELMDKDVMGQYYLDNDQAKAVDLLAYKLEKEL